LLIDVRIFLAGASGAIGRRLTPLLLAAGHEVTGTTRSTDKAEQLKAHGVEPVVVDVFDAGALRAAVIAARPEIVIHQLTDLPQVIDPASFPDVLARNCRLRIEGTANLVVAARAAGARRLIAQSIAFAYADGPEPHCEADALVSLEGDQPSAVTGRRGAGA
jgi:nucleoside-diphosphate-sugar epimerase